MRILFLSDLFPPDHLGGAGTVAYRLAKELRAQGHELFVITTVGDKSKVGHEELGGLNVHRIYAKYHPRWRSYLGLYNWQTVSKVNKIIAQIRPEVIHAHNIHYFLSYYSLKIAKKYCKKVYLTAHDTMLVNHGKWKVKFDSTLKMSIYDKFKEEKKRYNPVRNLLIRYFVSNACKVFAVSNALKNFLDQNGIKNVEVIHNGIDLQDWQNDITLTEKFKTTHNLIDKKIILFAGRLSELKGGEKILRAMKLVVKKNARAVLLVVGRKEGYGQEMSKLAKSMGIANNIIFTGWLDGYNLKATYFVSDLVVTPSIYYDPFNLVNIEAMAAKKPVIGTSHGGTQEIVMNNETGYIVDPNQVDILADKINSLLADPAKLNEFGVNGYKRVGEYFTTARQAKKTIEWYQGNCR